jgi:uncharacterized protein (TIGR02453 family)
VSARSSNLLGRRARCRLHAADPGDVLVSSGARDLLAQRIHSTDWETQASHRWLGDYPQSLERGGTVQEGLFTKGLFTFLKDLQRHNDRAWFAENKERYVEAVQQPALEFVRAFAPFLAEISSQFVADGRPVGGSLSRIYRDVRFTDKSPYKTHVVISFRHRLGKYVQMPGYHLYLGPGEVFAAAGIWHPDRETLHRIRTAIVQKPRDWEKATGGEAFSARFRLSGDKLKRAPAGFGPDHPLIEDLKWKDYFALAMFDEWTAIRGDFVPLTARTCSGATPFMRFLCQALGRPF